MMMMYLACADASAGCRCSEMVEKAEGDSPRNIGPWSHRFLQKGTEAEC